MTTGILLPEENSYSENEVEEELQGLFLELYEQVCKDIADEINFYGAPHIGPIDLVRRNLTADGLVVLASSDEDAIRYLHKAWKFRNPRRGLHFLRTYLQVLFGAYTVDQLWQLKTGTYPIDTATESEIAAAGESISNYFLTSRVRVRLTTGVVPTQILAALKSTVAARIVLIVQIANQVELTVGPGMITYGVGVTRSIALVEPVTRVYVMAQTDGPGMLFGASSQMYSEASPQPVGDDLTINSLDLNFSSDTYYAFQATTWSGN
jgi:hypothetical protein